MVAAILEGGRVTIDVALLRQLAAQPNTSLVADGPVVLLKPTTVTELLDAYEERDRLRATLDMVDGLMNEMHPHSAGGHDWRKCTQRTDFCITAMAVKRALEGRE